MVYKAVCFDMDGVLVDTMDDHAEAWNFAFQERGHSIAREYFYELEGMPGRKTIQHVNERFSLNLTPQDQEALYHSKRNYFVQHSTYSFYKDTLEAIAYLKEKNIPIGLATGSRKEFVEEVLSQLHFPFDAVITGDDVVNGKPSPEPYEKVFEQFDFPFEEWIVVENAPLGIRAAKASGAFVLAIQTTLPEEKLLHADHVLEQHKDLKECLQQRMKVGVS